MSRAFKPIPVDQLVYSEPYEDDHWMYRHIIVPKEYAKLVPKTHLMTETEWRNLGIQQSPGWIHYMIHDPEPHVLMFRKPKPGSMQQKTASAEQQKQAQQSTRSEASSISVN